MQHNKWLIRTLSKLVKGESGQVLPLVLILLVLGSTIMVGTLTYASTSLKTTQITEDRTEQLSAADAGVRYAIWKLTNDFVNMPFNHVPPIAGDSLTSPYPLNVNDKATTVDVVCIRNENFSRIFKIISTANGSDSHTTIESYVTKIFGLWTNAATGGDDVYILWGGGTEVNGPVVYPYDTSLWPFAAPSLRALYAGQAGVSNSVNVWDVSGVGKNIIGPLHATPPSGTLDILNSTVNPVSAVLGNGVPLPGVANGTVYVNGNLTIGKSGSKDFTLDLNRNTIYVKGDLLIDASCKLIGSGCIIAEGQIQFKPNLSTASPNDFVFLMSLSDVSYSVQFQPNGNFYGSVAGLINIDLHPGNHLTLTDPPIDGLNFPLDDGSLPGIWPIRTWQINRATGGASTGLAITTPSLAPGQKNVFYSQTLSATGGSPPYTWLITAGTPPAGLTFPATGILSGTPTAAGGPTPLTFQVTDSVGATNTKSLAITIIAGPIITSTDPLPEGEFDILYTRTLTASGGTSPYTWSVTAGSLPTGLLLDASTGAINGTPSETGVFSFSAKVLDNASESDIKILSIKINSLPVISTASFVDGEIGLAYSQPVSATGGVTPYTWSITPGALPASLTLNPATGVIGGTPTAQGTSSFDVALTDALGATASKLGLSITIWPALTISTTSLSDGVVDIAYPTQTLSATGGKAGYLWSITSGGLPAGLSLSTGVISGMPTGPVGTSNFTVAVIDALGGTKSSPLHITINEPLAITTTSLRDPMIGVPYSQTIAAIGGITPYTWSITGGTLPGWAAFDTATGVISGTPPYGTWSFTVTVTDSGGTSKSKDFSFTTKALLTITTTSLPNGKKNQGYGTKVPNTPVSVQATGGTSPYIWSITTGSLPPGLSLNPSSGQIYGTPTTAGTWSFTVTVTDSWAYTASKPLTITIAN